MLKLYKHFSIGLVLCLALSCTKSIPISRKINSDTNRIRFSYRDSNPFFTRADAFQTKDDDFFTLSTIKVGAIYSPNNVKTVYFGDPIEEGSYQYSDFNYDKNEGVFVNAKNYPWIEGATMNFYSYLPPYKSAQKGDVNSVGYTPAEAWSNKVPDGYLNGKDTGEPYDSTEVYSRNNPNINCVPGGLKPPYNKAVVSTANIGIKSYVTPPFLAAQHVLAMATTIGTEAELNKQYSGTNTNSALLHYKKVNCQVDIKVINSSEKYTYLIWGVKICNLEMAKSQILYPQATTTSNISYNVDLMSPSSDVARSNGNCNGNVTHNIPEYGKYSQPGDFYNSGDYKNITDSVKGIDPFSIRAITKTDQPFDVTIIGRYYRNKNHDEDQNFLYWMWQKNAQYIASKDNNGQNYYPVPFKYYEDNGDLYFAYSNANTRSYTSNIAYGHTNSSLSPQAIAMASSDIRVSPLVIPPPPQPGPKPGPPPGNPPLPPPLPPGAPGPYSPPSWFPNYIAPPKNGWPKPPAEGWKKPKGPPPPGGWPKLSWYPKSYDNYPPRDGWPPLPINGWPKNLESYPIAPRPDWNVPPPLPGGGPPPPGLPGIGGPPYPGGGVAPPPSPPQPVYPAPPGPQPPTPPGPPGPVPPAPPSPPEPPVPPVNPVNPEPKPPVEPPRPPGEGPKGPPFAYYEILTVGDKPFNLLPQTFKAWDRTAVQSGVDNGVYIALLVRIVEQRDVRKQVFPNPERHDHQFAWIAYPIGTGNGNDTNTWKPGHRYTYIIDVGKSAAYVDPQPRIPVLNDPHHYITYDYDGRPPGNNIFSKEMGFSPITVIDFGDGGSYDLDL